MLGCLLSGDDGGPVTPGGDVSACLCDQVITLSQACDGVVDCDGAVDEGAALCEDPKWSALPCSDNNSLVRCSGHRPGQCYDAQTQESSQYHD